MAVSLPSLKYGRGGGGKPAERYNMYGKRDADADKTRRNATLRRGAPAESQLTEGLVRVGGDEYQWQYEASDGVWRPLDPEVCHAIHSGWQKNKQYLATPQCYIDLNNMTQRTSHGHAHALRLVPKGSQMTETEALAGFAGEGLYYQPFVKANDAKDSPAAMAHDAGTARDRKSNASAGGRATPGRGNESSEQTSAASRRMFAFLATDRRALKDRYRLAPQKSGGKPAEQGPKEESKPTMLGSRELAQPSSFGRQRMKLQSTDADAKLAPLGMQGLLGPPDASFASHITVFRAPDAGDEMHPEGDLLEWSALTIERPGSQQSSPRRRHTRSSAATSPAYTPRRSTCQERPPTREGEDPPDQTFSPAGDAGGAAGPAASPPAFPESPPPEVRPGSSQTDKTTSGGATSEGTDACPQNAVHTTETSPTKSVAPLQRAFIRDGRIVPVARLTSPQSSNFAKPKPHPTARPATRGNTLVWEKTPELRPVDDPDSHRPAQSPASVETRRSMRVASVRIISPTGEQHTPNELDAAHSPPKFRSPARSSPRDKVLTPTSRIWNSPNTEPSPSPDAELSVTALDDWSSGATYWEDWGSGGSTITSDGTLRVVVGGAEPLPPLLQGSVIGPIYRQEGRDLTATANALAKDLQAMRDAEYRRACDSRAKRQSAVELFKKLHSDEAMRRRDIRRAETRSRVSITQGLQFAIEQTQRMAQRQVNAQERRRRIEEKERRLRRAFEDMLYRHHQERTAANSWDGPGRHYLEQLELLYREQIFRDLLGGVQTRAMAPIVKNMLLGIDSIHREMERRLKEEKEREGVLMTVIMDERQKRIENWQRMEATFKVIREEIAEDQLRIEMLYKDRARQQEESHRRRLEQHREDRNVLDRNEIYARLQVVKDEMSEYKTMMDEMAAEAGAIAERKEQELQERRRLFLRMQVEAREEWADEELRARDDILRIEGNDFEALCEQAFYGLEYIERPFDIEFGAPPEWVLHNQIAVPLPLCPKVTLHPRFVGKMESVCLNISSVNDDTPAFIELPTEETSQTVNVEDETIYIGSEDDRREVGTVDYDLNQTVGECVLTPGTVRVVLGGPNSQIKVADIALVMQALVFTIDPNIEMPESCKAQVMFHISVKVGGDSRYQETMHITFPVDLVEPLFTVAPAERLVLFKLTAERKPVQLIPNVELPGLTDDDDEPQVESVRRQNGRRGSTSQLNKMRQSMRERPPGLSTAPTPRMGQGHRDFVGGTISVTWVEDTSSDDALTVLALAKSNPSVQFEGCELGVTVRNASGGVVSAPARRASMRRSSRRLSRSRLLESDDYGLFVDLKDGLWSPGRIRRLLQSLAFCNKAPMPSTRRRMLEIVLVESPSRDPTRPPSQSSVMLDISVECVDGRTLWLLAPPSGTPSQQPLSPDTAALEPKPLAFDSADGAATPPPCTQSERRTSVPSARNAAATPFRTYRWTNTEVPPAHQELLVQAATRLCPRTMLMGKDMDAPVFGHIHATSVGAHAGEALIIEESTMLKIAVHGGQATLVYDGKKVGRVMCINGTQQQAASAKIEFNEQPPHASLNVVQEALRCLAFKCETRPRAGQRAVNLEVLQIDPENEEGQREEQTLRTSIEVRVLPPALMVAGGPTQFKYTEGQPPRRIGLFDCPMGAEEQLNFYDGGYMVVEVIKGADEFDHLFIEDPMRGDFYLEQDTLKQKSKFLNEPPCVVGRVHTSAPGQPLRVELGRGETWDARYIPSSREVELLSLQSGRGSSPHVRPKLLRAILSSVTYHNASQDPKNLHKFIRITVVDWCGARSEATVEVNINAVNNPTDVIFAHQRITYRQGTKSAERGLQMFPDARLEDVDTQYICPGGFMEVELVAGDTGHDVIQLGVPSTEALNSDSEDEQKQVTFADKYVYLGADKVGQLYTKEKTLHSGMTVGMKFTTIVSLPDGGTLLQSFLYSNSLLPARTGVRTVAVRFNAGDEVQDTRTKMEIDVLPSVIHAPGFTRAREYTEGGEAMVVNQKVSSGMPPTMSLSGCVIRAEIVDGFYPDEDVLLFSNPGVFVEGADGLLTGRQLGSRDKALAVVKHGEQLNNQCVIIEFPQNTHATVKFVNALMRGVRYHNTSKDPKIDTRRVRMTLTVAADRGEAARGSLATWPTEGLNEGSVDVNIGVISVDDGTELEPKQPLVVHANQSDPTLLFPGCMVEDVDTQVFPPHSYLEVHLTGVEKMTLQDHVVEMEENDSVSLETVRDAPHVFVDGQRVGRPSLYMQARSLVYRVELLECPLDALRTMVRSVSYRYLKPAVHTTHGRPLGKYAVQISVKAGEVGPASRARVQLVVLGKLLELGSDFDSMQRNTYMRIWAKPTIPLPLSAGATLPWAGKTTSVVFRMVFLPSQFATELSAKVMRKRRPVRRRMTRKASSPASRSASPRRSSRPVSRGSDAAVFTPQRQAESPASSRNAFPPRRSQAGIRGREVAIDSGFDDADVFDWAEADPDTDRIVVDPGYPYKVKGERLVTGKETVGWVREYWAEDSEAYGVSVTLCKTDRLTQAAFRPVLNSFQFVTDGTQGRAARNLLVQLSVELVYELDGERAAYHLHDCYCVSLEETVVSPAAENLEEATLQTAPDFHDAFPATPTA